ncbi:MAG: HAD domain-containing protein [Gallionella sp.]|nr:HAD domain-containing protein [Gallionella sp.]
MILFLDFDGVLHHENVTVKRCPPAARRYLKAHESRFLTRDGKLVKGKNMFEHADRLAAALEPFPDVRIVISSTWREHFRPEKLLQFLPATLADRVIGHTPLCDKFGGVGSRLFEILAYLEGNGLAGEPWIALDDQAQLFWDDTENPPDNLFILKGEEAFSEAVALVFSEFLNQHKLTDKTHHEQLVAPHLDTAYTAEDIQRAIADEERLGARNVPSDILKLSL